MELGMKDRKALDDIRLRVALNYHEGTNVDQAIQDVRWMLDTLTKVRIKTVPPVLTFYTDGGVSPSNPGNGGWGWVCPEIGVDGHNDTQYPEATNQQMEIMAAIDALRFAVKLGVPLQRVVIKSDSQYLCYTMTHNWVRKMNQDYWLRLDWLIEQLGCPVRFQWIPRDSDPCNQKADELSRRVR